MKHKKNCIPLKKHSFVCFFPNYQELTANQNNKKGILFIVYYIGPYYIILCIICRKKKSNFPFASIYNIIE